MLFPSTFLFCTNVEEKKKKISSWPGQCLCGPPPTSHRRAREVNWCVHIVPEGVSVGVGDECFPGWVPAWRPELSEEALPILHWNKWVGKEFSYLFLLIFLKCTYSTFISRFNIKSLWGLYLEV